MQPHVSYLCNLPLTPLNTWTANAITNHISRLYVKNIIIKP